MLDIGWSEMLIVGVVALIVVGPKDLPKMFHTLGQVTGKARGMAREFQRAMDVAAREAGVDTIAKDIRKVTSGRALKDAVGFDSIEKEFRDIGRDMTDVRKSPKAQAMPKAQATGKAAVRDDFDDENEIDEIPVHDYDADLDTRNAELSAVEEQRLIRAKKIAAARQQAAEIRSRREADEAAEAAAEKPVSEPQDWRPKPARNLPDATPDDSSPQPRAET